MLTLENTGEIPNAENGFEVHLLDQETEKVSS